MKRRLLLRVACSAAVLVSCWGRMAASQDEVIDRAYEEVRGLRPESHVGTIVAGSSIGRFHLGQTRLQARAMWGRRPDKTFVLPGGLSSDLWHWRSMDLPEAHHVEVIYRGGRVTQIEVASSGFQTAQGVAADGDLREWTGAYGHASRVSRYRYNARKKGVSEQTYSDWIGRGLATETRHVQGHDYVYTAIVHRKGERVVVDFDGILANVHR